MKLGIIPIFIHPASPQENGRHERMHRTLKKQTSNPPANNRRQQQARFDGFRRHYNEERPHEALGQRPPAEVYVPSPRVMPPRVEDPWYDADHQVRRVRGNGEIRWKGEFIFIGEALVDELIGIAELEPATMSCASATWISSINRRGLFTRFAPPREGLRDPDEQTANPNCRESCRSKVSAIIPVEPAARRQ